MWWRSPILPPHSHASADSLRAGPDALAATDTQRILEQSDLCSTLEPQDIARLRAIAQPQNYAAGDVVIRQGPKVDAVFLPCSGCLMVERSGAGGQRQVLAFLYAGYFLGFNTSSRFLYSVVALEKSSVLRFPAESFRSLAQELPALRDNIGRINNLVLSRVLDHLFAIGQKRAHARVAFLLWELWSRIAADSQHPLVHLPMRRADIGAYLGLTLETTSRAFSRLRRDGIIATPDNSSVRILDIGALQELADVK